MLSELDAAFKAAKFGETAAEFVPLHNRPWWSLCTFPDRALVPRLAQPQPALFEQLFRRDRQSIGDLGRAVEDFQNVIAEWTVKLARGSVPRGQFDPAKAGVAFGADDVAFFHAAIMHAADNRSKTITGGLN